MMVGPTKRKPRRFRSALSRSASAVFAGISAIGLPPVLYGLTADESPNVRVETAEFVLHLQEPAGILDGRLHFQPVTHYPWVGQQSLDIGRFEAGHDSRVEAGERPAVAFPLLEDGQPAETGLRSLQHQEFEEQSIIMDRHSPLAVVVGDVEGFVPHPGAARQQADSLLIAAARP